MKTFLLSVCLALVLWGLDAGQLKAENIDRPNVIILISDDQGWADIGYNNPRVYTPHLDQLASNGAILASHYVMPQCTPTRVALMTGRYPGRFGRRALVANNKQVIPNGTFTLATMLQEMGYETFMTGKWHLGSLPEYGPNHFGFDESHGSLTGAVGMYDHRYHAADDTPYDPTWHRNHQIIPGYENGTHVTDLTARESVRFIRKPRDKPFFLYVPFHAPHTPLDERGPFVDSPTRPDPNNPDRWLHEDRIPWFNDPEGKIQCEPERDKRLLLATLYHLDSAVGQIVQALDETGQRDETIILFSSDNGPWVDNHGGGYPDNYPLENYNQPDDLRGKKLDVYEGGIHVPGFINWPGKIAQQKVKPFVHIVDWFPTLAAWIGYTPRHNLAWDGVNIGPLLTGDADFRIPDRDLYWIWNPRTNRWALRYQNWKIVRYSEKEPEKPRDWELYNLKSDPGEKYNVAESHPDIVKKLHQRFLKQRALDYKGELLERADPK